MTASGISPLRSIFPMSVFFLMPFGIDIQLSISRSARAVVLALTLLLFILLFFRAVVIEQGLIPCDDQLHLGYSVLFEKGTDLVVQPPRKPRIVLLCRLLPFLFIPRLIISARAADRRIFFLLLSEALSQISKQLSYCNLRFSMSQQSPVRQGRGGMLRGRILKRM